MENAVASAGLRVLLLLIEVNRHVRVEHGLDVGDIWIVDVIFVDLFRNNEETHVILLL
jgi:hypothetical protein